MRRLLIVFLFTGQLVALSLTLQSSLIGLPIQSIAFEPLPQPIPEEELLELLPLRPGQPLTLEDIEEAIERLYQTGRYEDIEIHGEPAGSGVSLLVRTKPSWFVGTVSVYGVEPPPSAAQLVNATELRVGSAFTRMALEQAVKNLKLILQRNGFYSVSVDYRLNRDQATQQVHIRFLVNTGPRATFAPPVFRGDSPKTGEQTAKCQQVARLVWLENADRGPTGGGGHSN